MAEIRLPEQFGEWKVLARRGTENGNEIYAVQGSDGALGRLIHVVMDGELYSAENAQYLGEEAAFVRRIAAMDGVSAYIDAAVSDNHEDSVLELFILTEDLPSLEDRLGSEEFKEADIVDFGLKMSEILEKLEEQKMYHGNLKPSNVFFEKDGSVKLGGFLELENDASDLRFLAPEIYRNENPDFTTDTYSLGLMMYAMCNNGRLPVSPRDRLNGATFSAPSDGSQKLKSVVVIACQSENKNRWKNAGNLKNALASIKDELPATAAPAAVIAAAQTVIPENTEFDGNVFEEYDYGDFTAVEPKKPEPSPLQQRRAAPQRKAAPKDEQAEQAEAPEMQPLAENDSEPDNRVFDDYELHTKVFNINEVNKKANESENEYGDFFENYDEGSAPEADQPAPAQNKSEENAFYQAGDEDQEAEDVRGGRKGLLIGLILAVAALIALLAVFLVYAFKNNLFSGGVAPQPVETTAAATDPVPTAAPTTAVPTTEPGTTAGPKSLTEVVGWGYYYAEEVLQAEGYTVTATYEYNDYFDDGYVIEQNPAAGTIVQPGATITLKVSLGPENPRSDDDDDDNDDDESSDSSASSSSSPDAEGTALSGSMNSSRSNQNASAKKTVKTSTNTPASPASKTASDSVGSLKNKAVFSSFKNNTSYLSSDEVKKMSDDELELAINELYARRGYIFSSAELDEYFRSQSWYTPALHPSEFYSIAEWNEYEQANIDLLSNELDKRS